jgi:hypothetical protein
MIQPEFAGFPASPRNRPEWAGLPVQDVAYL